jgi:protein TonB
MFDSRERKNQRPWYATLPITLLTYGVGLFALIVIPMLSFELPALAQHIQFVDVDLKMPELPPPPAPPNPNPTPTDPTPVPGPPKEAPDKINPEPPPLPPIIVNPGPKCDGCLPITGPTGNGPIVPIPPPPGPPNPKVPDQPVPVGGKVQQPMRVAYTAPQYPSIAQSARVSGTVIIEAIIGKDGAVKDARVLRSIPLLDQAALNAVRQWRYSPTLLNGSPVEVVMTVTVNFTLQ